jgi:prepilin-type N-terminal cleavage/methylation domain-containing protein/prepilin-type processing-associated H-X9-DG protein
MASAAGRRAVRPAFTLIEVLVVVGIIALLMGLMLPALSRVRAAGMATADLSNMRGLSMAHLAYMNSNEERFVDVGLPHGSFANAENSFVARLMPYFGGSPVAYRSPIDRSPHWPADAGGDGVPVADGPQPLWRRTSYGMNNYLSRTYSPAVAMDGAGAGADRMQQVHHPDRTACFLLMAETGSYASADHPHVEEWDADPSTEDESPRIASSQVLVNAVDRGTPARGSQSNYSFLDGRVATLAFEDVFRTMQRNRMDPMIQCEPPCN